MDLATLLSQNTYFNWIVNFVHYVPLISFLAPIIGGGEIGMIITAFLFSNSPALFIIIVLFGCLGMITADSFWFLITRSRLFYKFKNAKKITHHYKELEKNIERISSGKDSLIIFISKIMIGTRILLIIYLSGRKISFSRYLLLDIIPNLIWATCLAGIGLLLAMGFSSVLTIFKNIQLAITLIIVSILIIYLIQKWITNRLTEKRGQ
ncbi:MAG: hypothetical protein KKA64_02280 [Nanoarchaeota archaeon]|nr:hypothetical protein [Nanoarchaeota archaeon]